MAMGASAQAGPFRPCSSSYPPLPSSSLCRSLSGPAWLARGPFPSLDRRALCSLQRLDAHCSDHTSYGSSRSIEPAVFTTRPVVTSHGMQTIDDAARNPRQPSKFGPAPNIVNMSRVGEESKRSFRPSLHGGIDGANAAVSGWRMEINKLKHSIKAQQNKLKFSVMAQQVREDIANGRISLQVSEHGPVMEVKMADFEVTRDGNTSEVGDLPQLSSFPNESGVNGGRLPQLARNGHTSFRAAGNLAVDIHRQFESSLMQTVNEDIDLDLYQTGEVNTNSSINGDFIKTSVKQRVATQEPCVHMEGHKEKLVRIYDKVLVVDNIETARAVVQMLTTKYKNFIHACDTEVANIDVKQETPVGHGEIICFSVYSGSEADFGNGKSCIWVDVLDGGRDVLMEFAPFFEDSSIKKVWHNYSFDSHIIENYGIKLSGFHADTMHLARLWDSSRRTDGGYSLEALTSDPKVIGSANKSHSRVLSGNESWLVDQLAAGKISMKSIFGKKKVKKDGSEGKLITIAPVEMLQRGEDRIPWICYSAFDSVSTLKLFNSLKEKLMSREWTFENVTRGSMYDFYEEYWRPFGSLLVKMESEGMLVDRDYLSEMEKVAVAEQQLAAERFRKWASKYCPDAKYMNVGSDTQLRLLFFGGIQNRRNVDEIMPDSKTFRVPNTENVIEEGKKTPSKYRTITLNKLGRNIQTEMYTPSGWPSVSGDALKTLAGKIPTDKIFLVDDEYGLDSDNHETSDASSDDIDTSSYGTAYSAFGPGKEGKEACYAIAALCEVCSIDSLISNFILPLQGGHISGKNGRIHCSLNINTETGRLSARRPNLQNQPALEKDRYKIRQAFIARPGNSLIVADYGQLELRILAHLANCKSMLDAFKAGGDFHSRTAMNMYDHVREAVNEKRVLLEWYPQPGEDKPPVPLLKDAFAAERRKAKMLNFSIAYGKTPVGLSRDWKVSLKEAKKTVELWYKERQEVLGWQEKRKREAVEEQCVKTLLGRARRFPSVSSVSNAQKGHIERAAINTPVQGSAADVAMCAMLEIDKNVPLRELGWKLLLQVHDEVILEGPTESAEMAKAIVIECMSKPFNGTNILNVDLSVDAKCAQNWYAAK